MKKYKIYLLAKDTAGGVKTIIESFNLFSSRNIEYCFLPLERDLQNQPSINKVFRLIRNIQKIDTIVRKERTSLVILFDFYSFIIGSIYKLLYNSQLAIVLYPNIPIKKILQDKPFFLNGILTFLFKRITIPMTNGVIYMSFGLKNDFYFNFKIDKAISSEIIYQGTPKKTGTLKLNNVEKAIFRTDIYKILSFGRFDKQKNFCCIIKAYQSLREELRNKISLILVGDGPEKNKYKKLIKNYSGIKILPWKRNVYSYLRRSQLFIFSSYFEGFGIAIIEALACGVPVISSDTKYGPREILENGKYGILVPIDSSSEIKSAIELLYKNKILHKKYSLLAKKRSNFFSLIQQKKQINNFITKILKLRELQPDLGRGNL